jgi:hypothetical protein
MCIVKYFCYEGFFLARLLRIRHAGAEGH